MATGEHRCPLAPLASLDASITEPISAGEESRCDTPTLSGYFECDQLSDMVDDSLFELTAAGCLSSSVFGLSSGRPEPAAAPEPVPVSAGQLLANRQPYDYSSSSSVRRPSKPSKPAPRQQQQQRRSRRPLGGAPTEEPGGHLCAQCRQRPPEEPGGKQRRRGLFGLFNLFGPPEATGGSDRGGRQDKHSNDNGQHCLHLQQRLEPDRAAHQQREPAAAAAAAKPRRSSSSSRIKSRDSIRLTNQRKQRSVANNGVRPIKLSSSHHHDLGGGAELLLDLSRDATGLRASQSSHSLGRRLAKSVKFTDQLLVAPPPQQPQQQPQTGSPLQPIIKRRIPKSSSYSQTESSRNLEALLAKYEGNEALVKEINEKLRLTETIASPRSALDVGQTEAPADASLMSCCDPNKHQAPQTTPAAARNGQRRPTRGKRRSECDPDNVGNGNIRTSSSSDVDASSSSSSSTTSSASSSSSSSSSAHANSPKNCKQAQ